MTKHVPIATGHAITVGGESAAPASRFQWKVVDIPRHLSRGDASALLTEQAEQGKWELARSALYYGGARRVWLRRRALRVERSDVI